MLKEFFFFSVLFVSIQITFELLSNDRKQIRLDATKVPFFDTASSLLKIFLSLALESMFPLGRVRSPQPFQPRLILNRGPERVPTIFSSLNWRQSPFFPGISAASVFFVFFFPSSGLCLTLSEALAQVASHPALVSQKISERQSIARSEDAGKPGPGLISFEAENFGGNLTGFSGSENTLSFRRPLLDRHRIKAERQLASISVREMKLETQRLSWSLSSAIQVAFHEVLVLKNLFEVALEGETIAQNLLEISKARAESGATPESEILKAELELNRALAEKRLLAGNLEIACRALARVMGIENIQPQEVVGDLTTDIILPEENILLQSLIASNLELQAITLASQARQAKLDQLRSENRPEYSLGGGIRDYREEKKHGFVLGLEIELPNKKGNLGERKAVALEEERVEAERKKLEAELKNLLLEARTRFETNRRIAADLLRQILPSSKQILELAMEAYRLGKGNQLLVLEAQKAVLENRRAYFQALGEMYSALNTMEKLCGLCFLHEKHGN